MTPFIHGGTMTTAFVYGTLRPGGALNRGWMSDAVHLGPVTAPGELRPIRPGTGGYPVWIPDVDGTVVGDLFEMTPGDWQDLSAMETGVGYTVEVVEVTHPDGMTSRALGFAWRLGTGRLGDPVRDGDWIAHVAAQRRTAAV